MSLSGAPRGGRIVIVGCGFPQLGVLRSARSLGLSVVGLDANPGAIGVAACDEFHPVSTGDPDGIARAVRAVGADGLTTCGSELALRSTAQAAELLGAPFYADSVTVERCQRKDLMRDAYRAGGAPSPAYVAAQALSDAEAFVRHHGLPIIVKPGRGWGQRGVAKVVDSAELGPAFARAQHAAGGGAVLVEQFIGGDEVSVNAYTLDGETRIYSVTERVITSYPDPPGITFAEWYPSGLEGAAEQAARNAAIAGVNALGIRRGPSYTQVRVGPSGACLVETAHRLGGGLDPDVALLASGVSLYRKLLGVALGVTSWERDTADRPEAIPVEGLAPEGQRHGGAIGKFLIGEPGTVTAIRGLEHARSLPGIVSAAVYVGIGSVVDPLVDGSKRAGHVLAFGVDRAEAADRAERAAATIQIVTRPA